MATDQTVEFNWICGHRVGTISFNKTQAKDWRIGDLVWRQQLLDLLTEGVDELLKLEVDGAQPNH